MKKIYEKLMDHSLLIAGEGIGGLWGGRSEEMWEGGQRMGGGGS